MVTRYILTIALTFLTLGAYSQSKLDGTLISKIENRIEKKTKQIKKQLLSENLTHPIYLEYRVDQFKIEEYVRIKTEKNWSTAIYIQELSMAEKRYQVLLSKYFNRLTGKLKPQDAQILEQSQGHWLAYKKNEMDLNVRINPEEYNKKGSLGIEVVVERHLDITKFRVDEIIDYIARTKTED